MKAYYNEIDPFAARWLENLISAGHIADGDVDRRSIEDVKPSEIAGYTQCHFFAGIGVWSHALRQAGWPDDRPVWTGSAPCQPFSEAGEKRGFDDERHLWPDWFHLIRILRPPVIFGEQVANGGGLAWFDAVSSDLEAENYAVGATSLSASGVGAPHIRQRLYFVANSNYQGSQGWLEFWDGPDERVTGKGSVASGLADAGGGRSSLEVFQSGGSLEAEGIGEADESRGSGLAGYWSNGIPVYCRDGKTRFIEPSTLPVAHGATQRVGRLRAYGNALVAPLAREFIQAAIKSGVAG